MLSAKAAFSATKSSSSPARPAPISAAPAATPVKLTALTKVAGGRAKAHLVLKGAAIYNVFTGMFSPGDLAIYEDRVAGIGPPGSYSGHEELKVKGFLIPGFIDSHVHIESSMASPQALAPTLLENGVTMAVADPHEIANVAGLAGLEWILAAAEEAAADFFFTLPSCVPAIGLDKGGAAIAAQDLAPYFNSPRVVGLGEMMNYPGVLGGDPEVMAKIALAQTAGKALDGHAPGVLGLDLCAYRASGVASDHEASTVEEAIERLEKGFWLMIREGTAARNLTALWPAVTDRNARFCLLATDDRHARDLVDEGSVNHLVRLALRLAPDRLPDVLNMASFNAAQCFGFRDRGALAPGFLADLALYPDLTSWVPEKVWKNGRLLVDGRFLGQGGRPEKAKALKEKAVLNSVRLAALDPKSLKVPATGPKARVIGLVPGQLVTDSLILSWAPKNGYYEANPKDDVAKMAVWNRYGGDGRAKTGFLKGLGLKRGALAQTVSHDSHQLVAAGANDEDLILVARAVAEMGGGLALALNGEVLGALPLPIGGLMSHAPVREIAKSLADLSQKGRKLGFPPGLDPFLALGFMSLPVIPRLKLTSAGLVEDFKIVSLILAG